MLEHGFLPVPDLAHRLPEAFSPWEEIAAELPKLLAQQAARGALERMPVLDVAALGDGPELQRAMLLLSYFGHGWVWQGPEVSARVPRSIAVPWHAAARRLGRPPVLSYASYALDNWRRLDPSGPIALGNLALLQNFLGGIDEEWFILVHVEIEARAAPALAAIPRHGAKNHPLFRDGIVYEGVAEYGGRGQHFRGETGAQSAIVPSLDAFLGIEHADDPLRPYLLEMRDYMTPQQRAYMAAVESGPSLRALLRDRGTGSAGAAGAAIELYDRAVTALAAFRGQHLDYADRYIHRQAETGPDNPTSVGTAGTPFMAYLRKHLDETLAHRLSVRS